MKKIPLLFSSILSSCLAFSQVPTHDLILDVDFEEQITNSVGSAITVNVSGNTLYKEAVTQKRQSFISL